MSFPLPAPEKPKELFSYKAVHETALKPGLTFWIGPAGETFFWADLVRVRYHPRADDADGSLSSAPEECITLLFQQTEVRIRGHQIKPIFFDCQRHLADYVRVSSREAIMSGSGLIVTAVEITEVKKAR